MASFMRRERQEASNTPRCEPEIPFVQSVPATVRQCASDLALAAGAACR
jgi:hypothetical protein